MAGPLYSADDYKAALLTLLPRGRVWPKDPDVAQNAVMGGLAETFARLDGRAQSLLVDAFPPTTLELLPEWEASLGLPDPCEGPDQVLQQRRTQVVYRLVNTGGQSVAYFIGVLSRLGYENATITQFAPFRADVDCADRPLYGETWWSVWQINLPDLRVFEFCADISAADEPLISIANDSVFCVIDQTKPAHTTVFYTNNP